MTHDGNFVVVLQQIEMEGFVVGGIKSIAVRELPRLLGGR
jgi:hypothetical protein